MMGSSGGDDGVSNLLAGILDVMRDDGKTRQRFEQLVKQHAENNKVLAECRNAQESHLKDKAALDAMRNEIIEKAEQHSAYVNEIEAKFKHQEGVLHVKSTELLAFEKALQSRDDNLRLKESNVERSRVEALKSRETADRIHGDLLTKREEDLKEAYKNKVASLEAFNASLTAKEAFLEKELRRVETDRSYWEEKSTALKRLLNADH